MANLITITDIQKYRAVSPNLTAGRLDHLIAEAQELDIKPIIGPAQYLDMVNNFGDAKYLDLLNGKEYLDKTINANVSFEGLRAALAYYSYARLLLNQDLHVTASGIVSKEEQWSNNSDQKRIQSQVSAARLAAGAHETAYLKFLRDNSADYPIWLKECVTPNASKSGGVNISRVTSGGHSQRGNRLNRCANCNRLSRYCIC